MSDLYHGEHPTDMTPTEARAAVERLDRLIEQAEMAASAQLKRTRPMTDTIHPAPIEFSDDQLAQDAILRFFHYSHLPPFLQRASKPFCELAQHIVETLPRNAERTVALRKLLEAKDAAVRANVG